MGMRLLEESLGDTVEAVIELECQLDHRRGLISVVLQGYAASTLTGNHWPPTGLHCEQSHLPPSLFRSADES